MSNAAVVLAVLAGPVLSPGPQEAEPDTVVRTTPEDREAVELTLYSQGFGLVTDVRTVRLGTGRLRLDFAGVAPRIQEATVRLRPGGGTDAVRLLEQTFRDESLTPERLLEAYVGRTVRVHPMDATGIEGAPREAELLSVEGGRVLRMDGRVTFGVPGRLSFPEVPDRLTEPPTLSWMLESRRERQRIAVSYLTGGMDWSADYVLALGPDEGDPATLTGWVTVGNRSGRSWREASLRLVAGDVRRVSGESEGRPRAALMEAARAPAADMSQEGLFAYHRYSLDRPVTLPDGGEKRLTLLEAGEVEVTRRHVVRGSPRLFRDRRGEDDPSVPVAVELELENREENGLGLPVPAGIVRVYETETGEGDGAFLGEDRVGHTPEGEFLRITTGHAFDLVAERVQTDYEALGRCASESAWEIRLRNHRDEAASVRVVEPASGEWEILESSHPAEKVDAATFRFQVQVPGRGEETIRYRVRVNWC